MTQLPTTQVPLHRRSIDVECFDDDGALRLEGTLRDERPWAEGRLVHHMELQLIVTLPELRIESATAHMHAFPHDECPFIAPKFAQLEGLTITRGFTRALRESFGGVSGCQHLHELARVMGPAAVQATTSLRASRRARGDDTVMDPAQVSRFLNGTCHVWSADGPGPRKVDLGWVPGRTDMPVPAVDRLPEALAAEPDV
jgi:hypothetical protein